MKPPFIDRNKEIHLKEIICCLTSIMYCLTSNLFNFRKGMLISRKWKTYCNTIEPQNLLQGIEIGI